MATKTPFVVDDTTGIPRAIASPDTIDPSFLPSTGPAPFSVDGGSATTTYTGTLKIDFGGAT